MKAAIEFLREQTAKGEVLVLAPSPEAADHLVRCACQNAMLGVHRYSPFRLAWAIAEPALAASGRTPIAGVAPVALAARVIHERRTSLQYFGPVAGTPGFPRALVRTLRELRMQRVQPSEVARATDVGPDLAALLAEYGRELELRRLVDEADIYAAATAQVAVGEHPLSGLPLLLLDFVAETRAECDFLDALRGRAPDVFYGEPVEQASGDPASNLESLQRYLFKPADAPPREEDSTFALFSASTEALECVEIARRIRKAADSGICFDQVAVLLRDPGLYQPLIEEALRRAGIPAAMAQGAQRPDPGGRAFLTLLHCARENLSAARFSEYLSLGQAPQPMKSSACERVLSEALVIGGLDRWHRRLDSAIAKYAAALAGKEDEEERGWLERKLSAAQDLRQFAVPLIELLSRLPAQATWGGWFTALAELAEAGLREPGPVLELLEELAPMQDVGPVDLTGVLLLIGDSLRSLGQDRDADRYGRVLVAPIASAAGMSFRIVFVPGLCEGIFPKVVREDPLLLDPAKAQVSADLPPATEETERRLLERAALAASELLVLSYPRMDVLAGRERVPSLYVFEAVKAARGSSCDLRRLHEEARRGAETRLGWPAPAAEADAIDDVEYDLAVLDRAFRRKEKGGGSYLTQVNPFLVHALRARGRRWRPQWFAEDGLANADTETLKILEEHRPGLHPYSPTSLQHYAACPYRFLLKSVLRLEPLEHPEACERMDALTRGSLFHKTIAELLTSLDADGLLPFTRENLAVVCERIDRTLDKVAAEFEEEAAPALPQVWARDLAAIRTDLRGWAEQQSLEPEWTPLAWEVSFGLPLDGTRHPRSVADPVDLPGVRLRGSIDLVERHTSGLLRVVDYKTGKVPSPLPQITGAGEVLQPALYAMAAEKLFGEAASTGRLHYATMRANYRAIDVPLHQITRRHVEEVMNAIQGALRTGFLVPAPRDKACERCDYQPVCGPYEAERTAVKDRSALIELSNLRRTP